MSADRLTRVLDAAYRCFARHGVRRTTMDDIAAEAGVSRPAVYQYVRNKDDAFARLAERLFGGALDRAREAAEAPGELPERLTAVLAAKLELVLRLWRDSPHHAGELIGESARASAVQERDYDAAMRELVAGVVRAGDPPAGADADRFAAVALAFTRGLEADPTDPQRVRDLLRHGAHLLAAGLLAGTGTHPPAGT
jgi:TetR/AcrR family transcriptional regulator